MSYLRYAVRIDAPSRHVVEIAMRFPVEQDRVEITLPAWCPGSYLIRDYARFVRDLAVTSDDGTPRQAIKQDKSTWSIDAAGARELTVRYAVYGHDLTVRTNHIDAGHAFLHGPATFLYPTHLRQTPVELELAAPEGWTLTTAMAWEPAMPYRMTAANVDELYDHPIHVGPTRTYAVPAKVPVKLAIWGDRAPGGTFDEQRLITDLGAIVDDHIARVGEAPFPNYTFLLMLAHDAYGGLEHRASSVNLFHPHFAASRKAYEGLLELLSHELFHAWNGKRIAPRPLLDVDYSREAYTPCLWVMEGLTSHYDRFALRTSGRITAKSFLDKVLDDWARLQATPGRARQSLEQSSFDAWIKLYKPDESNLNTTVSYYLKGGLAMVALDLHIRRRTEGARSLDDVLRMLWRCYGARNEPHPDDLQPIFEEASGLALAEVFDRQIRGTADPDLAGELAHVGLELRASADPAQVTDGATALWLGATATGTKLTAVFDSGPAHVAGLSPGDEIIALDGFRTTSEADLRNLAGARKIGDKVAVAVFRRHRLLEVPIHLGAAPPTRYEIIGIAEPGPAAARYQAWLGELHPGPQSVATVTTTARWV
ncbi:MAG: M61 family metallopeptidase [Deltaproteobacteria bacterium]|nr:M61 family metallopeptidase [Deltaproteobacteria bacterium]MDQ3296350.1 PDZ domain-containing protein [Myxococcota bacterium]